MKKALFIITTIGSSLLCTPVFSQSETPDSLGLPGDNLNLYAVLDIFQKSETLEEFEKSLNTENSKVNNLDLNHDDKTDYIKVIDNVKGTAHAIVLQVAVNARENQDVAVIEVERDDKDNVKIQVVGDELLYGKNYIIEPKQETDKKRSSSTPNPGYGGNTQVTNITNNYYNDNTTYNNGAYDYWYPASSWTIVRYMYYPTYTVYVSPWSWGYYPVYWNPWRPLFWHSYYYGCIHPHFNHYNGWYYRSSNLNTTMAHSFYGQRKSTSATVSQKRNGGEYKSTYSRPDLASKEISRAKARNENNKLADNNAKQAKEATGSKNLSSRNNAAEAKNNAQPARNNSESSKAGASNGGGNVAERNNSQPARNVEPSKGVSPKKESSAPYRHNKPMNSGSQMSKPYKQSSAPPKMTQAPRSSPMSGGGAPRSSGGGSNGGGNRGSGGGGRR